MGTYRARPVTRQAVQFRGGNAQEIRDLIVPHADCYVTADGKLAVTEAGREGRMIPSGDWVSLTGGTVTTHSDRAFRLLHEPVD